MARPPDDSVPEPIGEGTPDPNVDHRVEATGEISMLGPEEAQQIAADIRAIAESRSGDSEVVELVELAASGAQMRSRRSTVAPPMPIAIGSPPLVPAPDDELSFDELRDAWPLLDLEERGDGLRVLPREDAEEFFVALPAVDHAALLLHFRPGQRRQWMRLLEPDDVADVIQEADEEQRLPLLALLDAPTRKEVTALLAYAEDEAGGLMSTRYARLRPGMTVDEAISYLRRQARDKVETIYYSFVLDPEQRLLGVVSFRDLFAADPKKTVAEIMEVDVIRVTDELNQEAVSRLFAEHDLTVMPVVDRDGKMKGIVTVDDIVDVVREAATEDAQKFGGIEPLELPYLQSSRRVMISKRARWLAVLLVGEMFTATAMGFFETSLIPILSLFIPLIISSGGNSGSQASTLMIRAMALGEVRNSDWGRVFRREVLIGLVLGVILGAIAAVRVLIWGAVGAYRHFAVGGDHYAWVGLSVALAVVGCTMWGTLMGSMLPFVLRKLGADPASASAPLVATIVDVSGIVIYFSIAKLLLTGLVL